MESLFSQIEVDCDLLEFVIGLELVGVLEAHYPEFG